jgi:WD40 repeat protein
MTDIALLNRNNNNKEKNFKLNIELNINFTKEEKTEVMSIAFHQSVPYLASGFTNKKAKILMNGIDLYNLDGHTGSVYSVAFHPKKLLIATGSKDNTVKLWTFQHHNRPRNNNNIKASLTLTGHTAAVMSVAFYPINDQIILATGSKDGTAKIWKISENLSDAICITTLNEEDLNRNKKNMLLSVAFHPVHKILATGNTDNYVTIWYLNSDFSIKKIEKLNHHVSPVRTLAFSPNGYYLATGSDDKKVILYKIESEYVKFLTFLDGYKDAVRSVNFCSLDNNKTDKKLILASGSDDKTVKLWKIVIGSSLKKECLVTLEKNKDSVTTVAFFKNKFLATGSSDGTIKTYKLNFGNIRNDEQNNTSQLGPKLIENKNLNQNREKLSEENNSESSNNNSNLNNFSNDSIEPLPILIDQESNLLFITIPMKYWTPTKNSCSNTKKLYYSFMVTDLIFNRIQFIFEKQSGIDSKGLSKMVFDVILKVYIKLFFKKIVNNNDYLILKEGINLRQLIANTKKLIILANVATAKICLKIDPELLKLCESKYEDLMDYFNNTKQNFKKFYNNTNSAINFNNNIYNELNNKTRSNFLVNENEYNNKKHLIKFYKELKQQNSNKNMINKLVKEIRMRRFAAKCGFTSWKQLEHMCRFLEEIINYEPNFAHRNRNSFISDVQLSDIAVVLSNNGQVTGYSLLQFFDFKPKFDKKSILSRVQLIKEGIFQEHIDIENIDPELFNLYPALKPFVNYIIGPNSTDENRKKFVQFITGSEYSTDIIKIYLQNEEINYNKRKNNTIKFRLPFNPPSTCFSDISLLKRPTRGNYKNEFTEARIDELIVQSISTLSANNDVFMVNRSNNEVSSMESVSNIQNNNSNIGIPVNINFNNNDSHLINWQQGEIAYQRSLLNNSNLGSSNQNNRLRRGIQFPELPPHFNSN